MSLRVFVWVLLIVGGLTSATALGAPRYSEWQFEGPVAAVNSATHLDFPNAISKDGLSLYIQRAPANLVNEDLFVAQRASSDDLWGSPVPLTGVNSPANERAAFVSPDRHWLFFASDRSGGFGGFDLYASWRSDVHDDMDWGPAIHLAGISTTGFDSGPTLFEDGAVGVGQFYWTAGTTQATSDVFTARWNGDGTFGPATRVVELSSPAQDGRPYVSHTGLEMFLQSNRVGSVGLDIWVATRDTIDVAWSAPVRVNELSTADQDVTPVLSWDRETLIFGRATATSGDVYWATRDKVRGRS
jgi:hypothetical protein